MKFNKLKLSFFFLTYLFFTGACKKAETKLPGRQMSEPVAKLAAEYKEILVAASDGWYMLYKPTGTGEGVAIRLKFKEDDGLAVLAGYRNYQEEQTDAGYGFDGQFTPEIIFSDNSVFRELADTLNGSVKFKITSLEDGNFSLKRADGYDNNSFILSKINAENTQVLDDQIAAVLAQIEYEKEMARLTAEAGKKLADLVKADPGYYFKDLLLENFGAYLGNIDTTARSIQLTWPDVGAVTGTAHTLNYTLIPDGMVLRPAVTKGAYTIDTIRFGEFNDGALEITAAGNAGAGKLGWMHIPAYPYQNAISGAPADYTTADLFIRDNELPRFMGYTLDAADIYYSEAMQVYMEELKTYFVGLGFKADELLRLQFYNNNYNSTTFPNDQATRNQLQVLVRNSAGTSTFLPFFYDLKKLGPNHVSMVSFGTASTAAAPYKDKVVEFMNKVFTEEGTTIVPAGRNGISPTALQKLRLVSRKDSRLWIEILVNVGLTIYFD